MYEPLVVFKLKNIKGRSRELKRFRFFRLKGGYHASEFFLKGLKSPLLKFNGTQYNSFFPSFRNFVSEVVESAIILTTKRPYTDLIVNSLWLCGVKPDKISIESNDVFKSYLEFLKSYTFGFLGDVNAYAMAFYLNTLSLNPLLNGVGTVFVGVRENKENHRFVEGKNGFLIPITYYKLTGGARGRFVRRCIISDGTGLRNRILNINMLDRLIDSNEFIITSVKSLLKSWMHYFKKKAKNSRAYQKAYFTPNILMGGVKEDDKIAGFVWVVNTNIVRISEDESDDLGVLKHSKIIELVKKARGNRFYAYIDTEKPKWFNIII